MTDPNRNFCVAAANGYSISGPPIESFASLEAATEWIMATVGEVNCEPPQEVQGAWYFAGPCSRYAVYKCAVPLTAEPPKQRATDSKQAATTSPWAAAMWKAHMEPLPTVPPPTLTADEQDGIMLAASAGCDACDAEIGDVILRLVNTLEDVIEVNDKEVTKIRRRLTRHINRGQADCANLIERVATNINNVVANEGYTCQIILSDLRDKIAAYERQLPAVAVPAAAQVVMDLTPVVAVLECICEVLKEVRDRLPGIPHEEKGEEKSKEFPTEFAAADSGRGEPVAVAFRGVDDSNFAIAAATA